MYHIYWRVFAWFSSTSIRYFSSERSLAPDFIADLFCIAKGEPPASNCTFVTELCGYNILTITKDGSKYSI